MFRFSPHHVPYISDTSHENPSESDAVVGGAELAWAPDAVAALAEIEGRLPALDIGNEEKENNLQSTGFNYSEFKFIRVGEGRAPRNRVGLVF